VPLLLLQEVCCSPEGAAHQPGRSSTHLPGSCSQQGR
jgi:hypothetical protein